jgi:hypothetical protein
MKIILSGFWIVCFIMTASLTLPNILAELVATHTVPASHLAWLVIPAICLRLSILELKLNGGAPARPSSVSVVDVPADLNCKTSDGHYLGIDWERNK